MSELHNILINYRPGEASVKGIAIPVLELAPSQRSGSARPMDMR